MTALGIKYTAPIKAIDPNPGVVAGVEWTINIWDKLHGGADPVELTLSEEDGAGVMFKGDSKDLFGDPIRTSSIDIKIEVGIGDTSLQTWLASLISEKEQRYFVEVVNETAGRREGIYMVMQDVNSFPDELPYTFTLTASDGLERLKLFYFDYAIDGGNPAKIQVGDVIWQALKQCDFEQFYGGSDVYFRTLISWYAVGMDTGDSPLVFSRLNRSLFIKDEETNEPYSCFETIEMALKTFGGRLMMTRGCWHIFQCENLSHSSVTQYENSISGFEFGPLGSSVLSPGINATAANGVIRHEGDFTLYPALLQTRVKYAAKSGEFYSKSSYNTSSFTINLTGIALLETNAVEVKFKGIYEVILRTVGTLTQQDGIPKVYFTIDSGTKRLTGTAADGSQSQLYWTTDQSKYVFREFPPSPGNGNAQDCEFTLVIPPTGDAADTTLDIVVEFNNSGYSCSQLMKWQGSFTISQQNDDEAAETPVEYRTDNDDFTTNSDQVEVEIAYGDPVVSFTKNGLEIFDGAAWVYPSEWAIGSAPGSGDPIGQLLANTIMSLQKNPITVYQGSFFHGVNLDPLRCPQFNSKRYMFQAGTWSLGSGSVTGQWVEIGPVTSGLTNLIATPFEGGRLVKPSEIRSINRRLDYLTELMGSVTSAIGAIGSKQIDMRQDIDAAQPQIVGNLGNSITMGESDKLFLKVQMVDGKIIIIAETP